MMKDHNSSRDIMEIDSGNCQCFSRSCKAQRYYRVYDVWKGYAIDLIVCNEYVRLQFQKYSKNDYRTWNLHAVVAEKIISEHVTVREWDWRRRKNQFPKTTLTYTLCHRPYLYASIELEEAIELLFRKEMTFSCYYYSGLRDKVIQTIQNTCEYYLQYAKYKKSHSLCNKIIKNIKRVFDESEFYENLNQLYTELLTLNINKNETNKQ